MYSRAGLVGVAGKVRVDYRLAPELAAWIQSQAVDGRTATDVVEQALRLAQGQTGASPAAPGPLERQRRLNVGRG